MNLTKVEPFKSIIGETGHVSAPPPVFDSLLEKNLQQQVANIEKWARCLELDISQEQLQEAERCRPAGWPKANRPVVIVLAAYCASRAMYTPVGNTLRSVWRGVHDAMNGGPVKNYRSPDVIRNPRVMDRFDTIPGTAPFVGLRWETIDVFANIGKAPSAVRSPVTSPSVGILAIGMHHPKLFLSIGQDSLPNLAVPGYVRTMGSGLEPHVLTVERDWHFDAPTLVLRPESVGNALLAVPEFYTP